MMNPTNTLGAGHDAAHFASDSLLLVPDHLMLREGPVQGHAVMGVFDHRAAGSGMPGAPHVKVRGFALWGGVSIRRKHRLPARCARAAALCESGVRLHRPGRNHIRLRCA